MYKNQLDVKEILSKVNIVNVVKNYVSLTKKGRNYFGLCPFHNDSNPSMVVSEEKQIFKCFVCGTGGNAINFVQKKENISYKEALLKVAAMAGYDVSKYKNTQNDKYYKEKKCMSDLNEYYTGVIELNSNKDALDYCESRGLNAEVRKFFNIGYSPIDGVNTLNYLKGIKNDDLEEMYSVKLFQDIGISTYKNSKYRDINEDRIVFGISNSYNEIVAFSARYFREGRPSDMPKYVNTKETVLFHKSDVLYNYNNAKNYTKDSKYIYIVEGFMDVIALYKVGIKSVVGLMGTALSDRHIQILKNENVEVRLCLDNDNPGQLNTLSITKKLNKAGIHFRVVRRNELAKDSDEILDKYGKDKLLECVNDLISQQDFILDYYKNATNLNDDSDKKAFIRKIFKEIINIDDSLEIEEYCNKLALITGYSKINIEREFEKAKAKYNEKFVQEEAYDPQDQSIDAISYERMNNPYARPLEKNNSLKRINKLEHMFVKLMMEDKSVSDFILSNDNFTFFDPLYSDIQLFLKEYLDENESMNVVDFIDYVQENAHNPENLVYEITQISMEDSKSIKMPQVKKYAKELNYERQLYLLDKRILNEFDDQKKSILMEKKRLLLKQKRENM